MKVEKFFDGYNTIAVYEKTEGFTLLKYYADEYYSGDRNKLFAVRICGDDILDFHTLTEARKFFNKCIDTYRKCQSEGRMGDFIDEILKTERMAQR